MSAPSLPVFYHPAELKFIIGKPETHKQVLTIYNPYEFNLQFLVLSNAPAKFRVSESRGAIGAKCYVDIHLNPNSFNFSECLRIQIYREGSDTILGRKDVSIRVLDSDSVCSSENDDFHAFPGGGILKPGQNTKTSPEQGRNMQNVFFEERPPQNSTIFTRFLIMCLIVGLSTLLLPTDPDTCGVNVGPTSSFNLRAMIPPQVMPSMTVKLVSAFILGLVTYALFQQNN